MNSTVMLLLTFKNNLILLLFLALTFAGVKNAYQSADYKNFRVWGPGLNANFTMPVRYFFIQARDYKLKNISSSLGNDFFVIEMRDQNETNKQPIRIHLETLDRNDGSYVVRYRLYDNYENLVLTIRVKATGEHVGKSPYYLNGLLLAEKCKCLENDLEAWYVKMSCNQTYTQIEEDMKKFKNKKIDMDLIGNLIINKYNQRYSQSICNYVILNNKIYRKCYGEYVGFNMFSDAIFQSIANKVKLPDTEFFMNLGDWPLNTRTKPNDPWPIISWCGSTDTNDMILPTYELTESTLEMMARQSLDIFSVQSRTGPKWEEKFSKAFWRGRDSRQERLDLVLMSKQNSTLIDAALTAMFFYTEPHHIEKYGPIANRVPFYDFFQINIDGTVAAYRFPYLAVSDSLILKQRSPFYEHFYKDLKPYVHYIPVNRNLSNLVDRIKWSIDNEEKVKEIVKNMQNYAREYLMPNHVICYHVKFFEAYSKLIKSEIKVRDEMVDIETIIDEKSKFFSFGSYINKCKCDESFQREEKTLRNKDEL